VHAPAQSYDLSTRSAMRVLRIGVAVQCVVLAWLAWRHATSVDAWLFMNLGAGEAVAETVDRVIASVALVSGLVLLVRNSSAAALAVALVFLAQAVSARLVGGQAFFELSPMAHATRWLGPLALAALVRRPRSSAAVWLLRFAVAATFLAHAWQALHFDPRFVDLLLGACRRWTAASPSESGAHAILTAIGSADVAVALAILFARWPAVALWATVWGFATAASRGAALGTEFVHESLIRVMNGAAPLALWLLLVAPSSPPLRAPRPHEPSA